MGTSTHPEHSSPPPLGVVGCSRDEAASWGAAPDDPPPPMPWADVRAAAVVDVDADGTARCAAQLADEWLAGEDLAELHAVVGRQRLVELESDPVTIARLAQLVRVARGMRAPEEGTADVRFAPRQESTAAHPAPPAASPV